MLILYFLGECANNHHIFLTTLCYEKEETFVTGIMSKRFVKMNCLNIAGEQY
jgi:hypothetical protein